MMGSKNIPGNVHLSHDLAIIVSSALESFPRGTVGCALILSLLPCPAPGVPPAARLCTQLVKRRGRIVVVAVYNVATNLGKNIKVESVAGLFRIPSGLQHGASSTFAFGGIGSVRVTNPAPVVTPGLSAKPAITPPEGFSLNQLSPFYGQVRIGNVSPENFPNSGQFSLGANYSTNTSIDITGWHVKSNRGDVRVSTAVGDYKPFGMTPSTDIILKNGEYVNFSTNYSPISISFRLNECTGFLNNTYQFNPALPANCPAMYDRSEITSFSGACQNIVLSLGNCSAPTANQINSLPSYNEDSCKVFLDRFNYSTCYSRHRGDANFFNNEWRVWLSGQTGFNVSHDRLLLLDNNGLLVDQYIY